MRQFIILSDDEDLDALRNNKMVQVNSRHIGTDIYLTTQKGFEIDIKNDMDIFDQAAKDMDEARQTGHGCDTCKYNRKIITEEPCSSCYIHLGNNRWQPNDSDGGD